MMLDPDRPLQELMGDMKSSRPEIVSLLREAMDHLQKARTSISEARMKM